MNIRFGLKRLMDAEVDQKPVLEDKVLYLLVENTKKCKELCKSGGI